MFLTEHSDRRFAKEFRSYSDEYLNETPNIFAFSALAGSVESRKKEDFIMVLNRAFVALVLLTLLENTRKVFTDVDLNSVEELSQSLDGFRTGLK